MKPISFPLAVTANLSILCLCFLSRFDLIPPILFLPLFHVTLFLINLRAGRRLWQVIFLGLEHIAVTVCFIIFDTRLYQQYVYAAWDPADVISPVISLYIGIAVTVILLIISLIVFAARQKNDADINTNAGCS